MARPATPATPATAILVLLLSFASAFRTTPSTFVARGGRRIPSPGQRSTFFLPTNSRPRIDKSRLLLIESDSMAESSTAVREESPDQSKLWDKLAYTVGGTTSILVAGTFFVVLVWKRDAFMVCFFAGSILNAVLGKLMKKILNQDRPQPTTDAVEQPSDKGMPSSHAMSLGFIGMVTALTLEWTRLLLPLYIATSLYYRVKTKLHTPEQVAVGLTLGTTNGFLWNQLMDKSNLLELVSKHVLDSNGQLPLLYLAVPALIGAVVVGSLERKMSKWLKSMRRPKED